MWKIQIKHNKTGVVAQDFSFILDHKMFKRDNNENKDNLKNKKQRSLTLTSAILNLIGLSDVCLLIPIYYLTLLLFSPLGR